MVCQKLSSDVCFTFLLWTRILELDRDITIKFEREFLTAVNYNLQVSEKEYDHWLLRLETFSKIVGKGYDVSEDKPINQRRVALVR